MSDVDVLKSRLSAITKERKDIENQLNSVVRDSYKDFDPVNDGAPGNIGDWSEAYVFYRILEHGKVKTAKENGDGKIDVIYDAFLPVLKIIREENGTPLEYYTSNEANGVRAMKIFYAGLEEPILECETKDFKHMADDLLQKLQKAKKDKGTKTSSMRFPDHSKFLNDIFVRKIKSPSQAISESFGGKSDITMEIVQQDNLHVPAGFSIKSNLGSPATLINASKSNDTIYEVIGCTDNIMNEINALEGHSWVVDRTRALLANEELEIKFSHFANDTYFDNLKLIADSEPDVVAYALLYSNANPEKGGGSNRRLEDTLASLIAKNPLNIPAKRAELYYSKRLKDFLFEFACGMQVATPWDGNTKIQGGYIFVTKTGDVLAYYASDQDQYKKWLLENTRFDLPSTSRHATVNGPCCGYIHKQNGKYYYTLSTQIKFAG